MSRIDLKYTSVPADEKSTGKGFRLILSQKKISQLLTH